MKILITSDWYVPAVNGVVTSVKNLRRELEARGHEVRVLTLSQNRHSYRKDGVTGLGSVAAGLIYPGARLRTALAGKWVREIVEWGPDVVHSQCEFSTFFLARRIAEELDIPLVHTYHTVYEDYTHYFSPNVRFGKKAAAVFTHWAAAHTDCLIAPTGKVRLLLQGYGVADQVVKYPFQFIGVADDFDIRFDFCVENQLFFRQNRNEFARDLFQHPAQADPFRFQRQFGKAEPGNVKQLINQIFQPLRFIEGDSGVFCPKFG